MQYRQFQVEISGLAALDVVNKFLENNKAWHLWQIVPLGVSPASGEQRVLYVVEGPNEAKPDGSTPAGGLKDGATLSERTRVLRNGHQLKVVA
jgi:hypothetical protein